MDEIICKICWNQYNEVERIPKIIECGHSYCLLCLKEEYELNGSLKCFEENISFNEFKGDFKKLPTNRSLLKMVDDSNENMEILDDDLLDEVHLNDNVCPEHNKKLELICLNDSTMICSSCGLFGNHKKHNLLNIDEFNNKIAENALKLAEFKEKIKEKNDYIFSNNFKSLLDNIINDKETFFIEEINKNIDILIESLKFYKQKMLEEINLIKLDFQNEADILFQKNNIYKQKENNLNKKIELILENLNSTQKIDLNFLIKNLYYNNEIENNFTNLLNDLEKVEENSINILNEKTKKYDMVLNIQNILTELPNAIKFEERKIISFTRKKSERSLTSNSKNLLNPKETANCNRSFLLNKKKVSKNNSMLISEDTINNNILTPNDVLNINDISHISKENLQKTTFVKKKKKINDKFVFDLSSNNLSDKDLINKVTTIKSKTLLKKLILNNNKITDFGFKSILMKLKDSTYLEYIDLGNNWLTDLSISFINVYYKKYKNLKTIIIANEKINLEKSKYLNVYENLNKQGLKIIYK